ncbi:hypothetical protein [Paenibacillus pseudetheri]|uniref:Uncharacterized protein n=1 Tax=Paenibacillus pseudetheri TaxID=2897682 RepID=A0ABM9BB72_9BACL|nr:hypothetical protein [Paenibacillus pseudetheri]CAH1055953.1 hypothetical protein PAECIP111894_02106 [Paenibacillus pseudetheri]
MSVNISQDINLIGSYPTPDQINQRNYLNSHQDLMLDFVTKQRAGQNPPLPDDPHNFNGMKRDLLPSQVQSLVNCANVPINLQSFGFVFAGPSQFGPFKAELVKITFVDVPHGIFGTLMMMDSGLIQPVVFKFYQVWAVSLTC